MIAFPTGDDVVAVGEGFALLAGSPAFNSAVGAIDACHIRLKPPATTAQCYLNRKLFLLHPEGCRMTKPEEEQQHLNVPFPPMVGIQPNCSSEGQDGLARKTEVITEVNCLIKIQLQDWHSSVQVAVR